MKNKDGLTFGKRLKIYIRKNAFTLAVSGCAVLLVVALAVTAIIRTNQRRMRDVNPFDESRVEQGSNDDNQNRDDVKPSSSDNMLSFVMPVQNYQIGSTFVNDNVVYNETMNEWTTHVGVDFVTDGVQDVLAIADGTIESIKYSPLEGTIVAIKHSDELVSVYKSLASDVEIEVGDMVKAGDKIGTTSTTAQNESKLGSHLHLELLENGKNINPFDYLSDK